jgi:hypothetical protein
MDQTTILIISSSLGFCLILFFFMYRSTKRKPLTLISEIVEDKRNPGVFHIFGAITYMPEDGPSFEKYRHYLLITSDMKVIRGLEQTGSDFDVRSPFVTRCLEHMKTISGRNLELKLKNEEEDDEDEEELENGETKNNIRIIKHDRNESDTMVQKAIKGNVIEVFDTSYGELNSFALKISLDNMTFSIPKVKGLVDFDKVLWRKNEMKLFIFYNRMVLMKFGVGMLVLDTSTGNVLSDDYFREN